MTRATAILAAEVEVEVEAKGPAAGMAGRLRRPGSSSATSRSPQGLKIFVFRLSNLAL
jgi:hypothetical protein